MDDDFRPSRRIADLLGRMTVDEKIAQLGSAWVFQIAGPDGFDPAQAAPAGHYGLLGMHERARLLGGSLTVTSAAGEGTCVRLAAPAMTQGEAGA